MCQAQRVTHLPVHHRKYFTPWIGENTIMTRSGCWPHEWRCYRYGDLFLGRKFFFINKAVCIFTWCIFILPQHCITSDYIVLYNSTTWEGISNLYALTHPLSPNPSLVQWFLTSLGILYILCINSWQVFFDVLCCYSQYHSNHIWYWGLYFLFEKILTSRRTPWCLKLPQHYTHNLKYVYTTRGFL